jgi:hypothetical protein
MKEQKDKIKFGQTFKLEDDKMILQINSPKKRLKGPYVVVYKNIIERWAIVAYDWDNKPCLGIRWFRNTNGNPISNAYATWLVIPSTLTKIILEGLPIDDLFRDDLNRFLKKEIQGNDLKKKGEKK